MKKLLVLCLVMASFASFAHGGKRLTTTTCTGKNSRSTVLIKFDTSITPFGPTSVKINGEEVIIIEELGTDYMILSGNLSSNEEYSILLKDDNKFETTLYIADAKTILSCESVTKFRLY